MVEIEKMESGTTRPPRSKSMVGVVGSGSMATQLSALLSCLRIESLLLISDRRNKEETLQRVCRARKRIGKAIDAHESHALVVIENFDNSMMLDRCKLVIECGAERLDDKLVYISGLKERFDGFIATNTSSFSPCLFGADVIGVHFMNPIETPIIEVTENCPPKLYDFLLEIFGEHHKLIRVPNRAGYIVNRILFGQISLAIALLEDADMRSSIGELEDLIDLSWVSKGLKLVDLIGVDVTASIIENLEAEVDYIYGSDCLKRALANNVLGKKNKTSLARFISSEL